MKLSPHAKMLHSLRGWIAMPLTALLVISLTPATAHAATVWQADFSAPSYEVGKTVIGQHGWVAGTIDSGTNSDASVVLHSPAPGRSSLHLNSTSDNTDSNKRRTGITNSFETVSGSKVKVDIVTAFDWTGKSGLFARFALNADESSSPLIISFSGRDGLILGGTYGDITNLVIMEASQVAKGAFYQFSMVLDFEARLFDLSITGVDPLGAPYSYTAQNIAFRSNTPVSANGVGSLSFTNGRGDYIQQYVDSIHIEAIPEGSTMAMIAIGGATLACSMKRRKALR